MFAEAVVSFAIEKLGDLLIHEGGFLREVCDEVEWVKKELTWMQAFLKDAETKQEDARVKKWVEDVRDIAYKAEDVIDEFIFKIEQKRRGLLSHIPETVACRIKKTYARHQLGKEIAKIKNELDEISKKRSNYGIKDICQGGEGSSSMSESLREQRRTSHLYEQTEFVGFQEDVRTLVTRLTEGEQRRCVISIVGMGGLGKTTLARKVYNHDAVKMRFNCCAWIYVSQEYNVKDLLLSIMRCFKTPKAYHKMIKKQPNVDQLRVELFEDLKVRRYFVVVDDIWKTEAWDALAPSFPDMKNGSRILLTARNKQIASYADARCHPHELRFLREDESWELFHKKVFFQGDSDCPQYLEGLGRKIVEKCHGLPLAIVVISGLLSRKAGLSSEWEKVHKSISWQFVEGDANISPILALSYEDLPHHLKSCFLFLGAFPEDYEISVQKLIRLWVAEGFIHSRGAETLEEVAEDCVQELIQRSLIQVAKKNFIGAIKSCRIHDLLRDLSISKAKEENFLHGDTDPLSPCKARRLSVHHSIGEYTSLKLSTPCVRSILCFPLHEELFERNQQKFLFQRFHLLRVLHLHGMRVKEFPDEIGTLVHLRYLDITGHDMNILRLPSSIANLCNLQTLEIVSDEMSIDIWKMPQLRHVRVKHRLRCEGYNAGGLTGNEHNFPRNLQTLRYICAGDWIKDCLGELVNLRNIAIFQVDLSRHGKGLFDSIPKLDHLRSLSLYGANFLNIANLFPAISNRPRLNKLHLSGRLKRLPETNEFSPNLTRLTLRFSKLVQDPMTTLEKLPNLQILKMKSFAYEGKEMVCSAQGFPRLKSLRVDKLINLERWIVEEGAMPSLLHLHIFECQRMKMLPEGLEHVTALRNLELISMRPSLINGLGVGGVDWHKIQHIPSIDIKYTR